MSDKERFIEIGTKLAQIVGDNKDLITGAFMVVTSENDKFVVAHGDSYDVTANVLESLGKLSNPVNSGIKLLSGTIRNDDGEVVITAEKGQ